MNTSRFDALDTWYALRISEYVMPPNWKTISLCLGSLTVLVFALSAHCGRELRSEAGAPAATDEAALFRAELGASLT